MTEVTAPIARFLEFTAMLRRAGFAIAPEQTMAWLAAIELLGPTEVDDVRRAARATLAPPPERFAEFDALFDAHFLGALHPSETSQPSDQAPLQAAEDGAGGLEPLFDEVYKPLQQFIAEVMVLFALGSKAFAVECNRPRRFHRPHVQMPVIRSHHPGPAENVAFFPSDDPSTEHCQEHPSY